MSNENKYFKTYLKQLVFGCQASLCNNQHCRSSSNFINIDIPEGDENNKIAIKVASELSVDNKYLCHNMAPILYNLDLYQYVQIFKDFSISLITDQPIEQFFANIEQIFDNLEAFAFCFYENPPGDLTMNNLQLNDGLLSDFYDATFRRRDEIKPLFSKYESMINNLIKFQYFTSLYHLRSILLAISFGSFNVYPYFKSIFLLLIKHIIDLDDKSKETIIHTLSQLPKFLKRILATSETNLSLFSLNTKLMISINSNLDLKLIITFIKLLFNSSERMTTPLPVSSFANDAFSNLLDPRTEFVTFFNGQVNFLAYPMILTLSFKDMIRKCECRLLQYESVGQNYDTYDILRLKVNRNNIVQSTVSQLSSKTDSDLRKRLYVQFEGEDGIDAGGLSAEFIHLATTAIFSPDYGMFELYEGRFYWFSLNSENDFYYKTLGTLVGIAIYNSIILPIRFPRYLYKKLLTKVKPDQFSKICTIEELREFKPEVADNLVKLREMEDVSLVDVTFSIDYQRFGKTETVELIEGGSNITVTNENVNYYIQLYLEWSLDKSIENQYKKFEEGFMKVFGKTRSLEFLYPEELDTLVSGSNVIRWDELRGSTKYTDGYDKQSPTILMFWEVFNELNDDQKSKLLLFTCGTDRVPINGLKDLHFTIQRTTLVDKLPIAHTCSKTLSLPDYKNIDVVRKNLMWCLYNCEGFDLA